MGMIDSIKLRARIEEYLFENAHEAPLFLDAISGALKSYQRSVKLQRDNQTMNALGNVSAFINKKDVTRYPYAFIEFFFLLFPHGHPMFHSVASKSLFEAFQIRMRELGDDGLAYIKSIHGEDVYQWIKSVVEVKTLSQ